MAYRIEYARSGRSGCKGPLPCKGTKIEKDALRIGSVIDVQGTTSMVYSNWGFLTEKVISNMKKSTGEAEDLDGIEDLTPADREKVEYAYEHGHIRPEDVTPAMQQKQEEEDRSPKKEKSKKSKKKAAAAAAEEKDEQSEKEAKEAKKQVNATDDEAEVSNSLNGTHEKAKVPKGRPSKKKQSDEEAASLVKTEVAEDAAVQPKKRGRPPKVKDDGAIKSVLTSDNSPAADTASEPVKKKRGRPAKSEKHAAETKSATEQTTISKSETANVDPVKKKRGRPSKADMAARETDLSAPSDGETADVDPVKKKKGRPSKADIAARETDLSAPNEGETANVDPVKKKRGRPSKADIVAREADLSAPSDGETANVDPVKKKRGRPSKADIAAREADLSAPSDGDGETKKLPLDNGAKATVPAKKRGRPSKADLAARTSSSLPEAANLSSDPPSDTLASDANVPAPKKRGRPKKEADPDSTPKKRGRPKKSVSEDAAALASSSTAVPSSDASDAKDSTGAKSKKTKRSNIGSGGGGGDNTQIKDEAEVPVIALNGAQHDTPDTAVSPPPATAKKPRGRPKKAATAAAADA